MPYLGVDRLLKSSIRIKRMHARASAHLPADVEEVPGLIVYGLVSSGTGGAVEFPSDTWFGSPEVEDFTVGGPHRGQRGPIVASFSKRMPLTRAPMAAL